jgi:hypothetical protein
MKDSSAHLKEALTGVVSAFTEPMEIKKVLLVATHDIACNIAERSAFLEVRPLSEFTGVNKENAVHLMRENFIPVLNPELTGNKQRKYYKEAYCVCYVDTVIPGN